MKKRRGQLKSAETMAALFIFIILFVVALMSYMKYQQTTFAERIDKLNQKAVTETSLKISTLPELKCVRDDTEDSACIDRYKLESFLNIIDSSQKNRLIYDSIFAGTVVTVYEVFPTTNTWTLYDDSFQKDSMSIFSSFYPITIYDPVSFDRSFGYLDIKIYMS